MESANQGSSTLELLAVNEETLSRLYMAYAGAFPASKEFWGMLAEEEKSHAAWIRQFIMESALGRFAPNYGRFKGETIRLSMKHAESEISLVASGAVNLVNALSIANAIEHSLIESRFFEVFETDSVELKVLLTRLAQDTRRHARMVTDRWNAETVSQQSRALPRQDSD